MAVDYNVIVKGLEPKLGKFSKNNEQKYRTYFDKLVQIQFALPMIYYNLKEFLDKNLHEISFLNSEDELDNHSSVLAELSEIAQNSIGRNPRNLKRLVNALALTDALRRANFKKYGELKIYKDTKVGYNYVDIPSQTPLNKKKVIFTLACIQIAYYDIYLSMLDNVNFIDWDKGFLRITNPDFNKPSVSDLLRTKEGFKIREKLSQWGYDCGIDDTPYYWEVELYEICQRNPNLKDRTAEILFLFNYVDCIYRHNHTFMLNEFGIIMSWLAVSDISTIYGKLSGRSAI